MARRCPDDVRARALIAAAAPCEQRAAAAASSSAGSCARAGKQLLHAAIAGDRLVLRLRLRKLRARRRQLLLQRLHLLNQLRDRGHIDHRKLRLRSGELTGQQQSGQQRSGMQLRQVIEQFSCSSL